MITIESNSRTKSLSKIHRSPQIRLHVEIPTNFIRRKDKRVETNLIKGTFGCQHSEGKINIYLAFAFTTREKEERRFLYLNFADIVSKCTVSQFIDIENLAQL